MPKTTSRIPLYVFTFLIGFFITYLLLTLFYPLGSGSGSGTITVEGQWDKSVFNAIKGDFLKDHPDATVIYQQRSASNYYANLTADLKSGEAPDVFWWDSSWGPVLASTLAPMPSSVYSNSSYEKTFYPVTKTDMKINSNYVGLPIEFDGLALLYNKDIFAAKNFPSVPKTWTSLSTDYVPSLTTINQDKIVSSAIALGSANNITNVSDIIGLFFLQNGVNFVQSGNLLLGADKTQTDLASQALDFFFMFNKNAKTWDNTQANSLEEFARGNTAMILLPAYQIHNLLAFERKENLKVNFGVAPVPQLPSSPVVTWARYWSLGVNTKSSQKTLAWQFAKFIEAPDTLRKISSIESKLDGFGRAYPQVAMASEQEDNVYLGAYLLGAKSAHSWYLHDDTSDTAFQGPIVDQLKKTLQSLEKNDSTSQGVKNFASGINPILTKYGVVYSAQ